MDEFEKLKYFRPNVNNINTTILPWTKLYPGLNYENDQLNVLYIKNIRIVYKPRDDNINFLLEKNLIIKNRAKTLKIPLKFAVLIEQHLLDGDKITYNQLNKTWIIPINLSLFGIITWDTDTDFLGFSNIDENDYYFEIQNCPSLIGVKPWISNNFPYSYYTYNMEEFVFRCGIDNLLCVVWENEVHILDSYILSGKITVSRQFFKQVQMYDKKAIIIPLFLSSFSNFKYLLKNILLDDIQANNAENANNADNPNYEILSNIKSLTVYLNFKD